MQALVSVAESVTSTLDPTEIMRRVCREATRLTGADSGVFWEANEGERRGWPAAAYHVPRHLYAMAVSYPVGELPRPLVDAFLAREPVFVSEVASEPRFRGTLLDRAGARSVFSIPVFAKAQRYGGLVLLWWQRPGSMGEREIALASILVRQGALALENARLHEEVKLRLAHSETLLAVSETAGSTLELSEVLRRTTREMVRALGGDTGGAWILSPDRNHVRALAGYRVSKTLFTSLAVAPIEKDHPLVDLVRNANGPVWTSDSPADPTFDYPVLRLLPHRSVLIHPVDVRGTIIGIFVVLWLRDHHRFTDSELRLVSGMVRQAAVAIENARLYEEARGALAELKTAQDRLVQAQTLRALGELASGAAHHLNNLLTIVFGRAELLLARCDEGQRRALEVIVRAAKDGAAVVRRIQQFSRTRTVGKFERVALNEVVAEVVEMTRPRWHDRAVAEGVPIEVECRFGAVPPVPGSAEELREVLTNLVLNSVDALPRGGRITVSTATEPGRVVLVVTDTGVGMSPETLRRACEPFYTTKGVHSTGLGLSVSYGIVQRHGGDLTIDSAEGQGTAITIRLPLGAIGGEASPEEVVTSAGGHPLRILVVDDEQDVREVLVDLIAARGHVVTSASGGDEALTQLERGPLPDVVFTDLGMPGMTGWDLTRMARARWPGLLVGLVTGWGEEPPTTGAERPPDFILTKPVDARRLRDLLAQLRSRAAPRVP